MDSGQIDALAEYRAWKSWDQDVFGHFDLVQARYFEAEFRTAGVMLDANLALLEIGFGNAALAFWAQRRGWSYSGTELDPELVVRARAAGLDAYLANIPIAQIAPGDAFDLIVIFDVLEHLSVDEIVDLLESVNKRLKRNGRLIARFPSGDSPFSGAIQRGDLTHQTAIGSGMVEQLAARTGFRVLQIRAPAFPLMGLGIRRMLRRLPVIIGRKLANRAIQLLYLDNQPRVIEPNMLVVLEVAGESLKIT